MEILYNYIINPIRIIIIKEVFTIMKTTIIRRSLIIALAIVALVSLTGCAVDATVRAEISGDRKEVIVFTTKNCYVDLTVEFSTGETLETTVYVENSKSNVFSVCPQEYFENNNVKITNVVVANPSRDGLTPLEIALQIANKLVIPFVILIFIFILCLIVLHFKGL